MKKIAIIGAGRVGETSAQILAEQELCSEIVLVDIREDAPQGVALDIFQTAPFFDFDTRVTGSNDAAVIDGADLVIITAGVPRKPGMSRSDVLHTNITILDGILDDVLRYAPDCMLLLVSNPVDILTWHAWRRTGWERSRVFGQAGVLDSSRMAAFIAMETGFSTRDITTIVLGGHGDTMVPLPRFCTINGIPISHFIAEQRLQRIIERTRLGGAEILALRKNSSAYDAPGAAVATMVDAISHDRRRIVPTVVVLEGEYGERAVAMGVPCVLSRCGMERIIEMPLNEAELQLFHDSSEAVRADIQRLGS
jgi:malate dehydrogenase